MMMTMDDDTFRAALRERLTTELGDGDVAAAVAGGLDGREVARLHTAIGDDGAPTAALLRFRPATAACGEFDAVIAFAFGNRLDDEGAYVGPGPINLHLAGLADDAATLWNCPVFAQWEIAEHMDQPRQSIEHRLNSDGTIDYLSTVGVAEQVRAMVTGAGQKVHSVGVLAFADHAERCCRVIESLGFTAAVPTELTLPVAYDGQSGQLWTRTRAAYVASDLRARLAMSTA